jgi:hypothetical protein
LPAVQSPKWSSPVSSLSPFGYRLARATRRTRNTETSDEPKIGLMRAPTIKITFRNPAPCSEQASAFPVFSKKNESFSFADEHAAASQFDPNTFFVKANLVGSRRRLPYFVSRDVASCCSVSFSQSRSRRERRPSDWQSRVRKQHLPASKRHRYP